jgi:hypothetical protein
MKFKRFLDVARTPVQAYFKEGVELIYPDQKRPLQLVILPAYNPKDPSPTGFVPAVVDGEESDFYTVIRAAKFVGHGNRRAKTSFLSPKTFDLEADDPYDAFYDYCSRSDKWSYLTKDGRKRLTGEVEGAVFPRVKNFFCANVVDATAPRGGVFVTELSESVMKGILYSTKKNGARVDGLAFQKDDSGNLVFGDITNPDDALVIEIAWSGKGYVARPALCANGTIFRTKIPETLLQHRLHMEEPGTCLVRPESGQEIVDRLAGMLRGYRSEYGCDEIEALKEAMAFAYGDKYTVDDNAQEEDMRQIDPFAVAAKKTVEEEPEKKAEEVSAAVDRGVEREKYTPVSKEQKSAAKKDKKSAKRQDVEPETDPFAPGENVDISDLAAMRAMLAGGN